MALCLSSYRSVEDGKRPALRVKAGECIKSLLAQEAVREAIPKELVVAISATLAADIRPDTQALGRAIADAAANLK